MKLLGNTGLNKLISLIKTNNSPVETHYHVELQPNIEYTFTVPSYKQGRSLVEVYKNGLRQVFNVDYQLSTSGVIKLLKNVHNEGNFIHVIHKKWS